MLKTARVVIVDEIHAVLESRRGAHLAITLERLEHACGRTLQRIGLSATQKPIEEVAQFLVGSRRDAQCASGIAERSIALRREIHRGKRVREDAAAFGARLVAQRRRLRFGETPRDRQPKSGAADVGW